VCVNQLNYCETAHIIGNNAMAWTHMFDSSKIYWKRNSGI